MNITVLNFSWFEFEFIIVIAVWMASMELVLTGIYRMEKKFWALKRLSAHLAGPGKITGPLMSTVL